MASILAHSVTSMKLAVAGQGSDDQKEDTFNLHRLGSEDVDEADVKAEPRFSLIFRGGSEIQITMMEPSDSPSRSDLEIGYVKLKERQVGAKYHLFIDLIFNRTVTTRPEGKPEFGGMKYLQVGKQLLAAAVCWGEKRAEHLKKKMSLETLIMETVSLRAVKMGSLSGKYGPAPFYRKFGFDYEGGDEYTYGEIAKMYKIPPKEWACSWLGEHESRGIGMLMGRENIERVLSKYSFGDDYQFHGVHPVRKVPPRVHKKREEMTKEEVAEYDAQTAVFEASKPTRSEIWDRVEGREQVPLASVSRLSYEESLVAEMASSGKYTAPSRVLSSHLFGQFTRIKRKTRATVPSVPSKARQAEKPATPKNARSTKIPAVIPEDSPAAKPSSDPTSEAKNSAEARAKELEYLIEERGAGVMDVANLIVQYWKEDKDPNNEKIPKAKQLMSFGKANWGSLIKRAGIKWGDWSKAASSSAAGN